MSYTVRQNPSPHYTEGRSQKINKIVVHHAATTDFDGIGRTFRNVQVSAHYGVGRNQNVDQYVDEANTAWHAGLTRAGVANPNPSSIGIENVNSSGAPNWDIAPETFNTLVELVRDIAKRHGLFPVRVGVNLFQHSDFGDTFCAGQLRGRLQELADAVNNGTPAPGPAPGPDQILEVGSNIQFQRDYRVDNMAFVQGTWQVQTNALCPKGFTWDDNGIPVEPLFETSDTDQVLNVGSTYKIPGTYRVLNLGQYQDRWMAQLNMGGWSLWVDVETVTEV